MIVEQLQKTQAEAQKFKFADKKGKGKEKVCPLSDPDCRILTPPNRQAFSLQDHQRIALLSGKLAHPDDEDSPRDLPETIIPLSHVQEERALRDEVTRAFHTAIPDDEEEEDEEDGFLVKREKTDGERDAEKEAYRRFLLANGGGEDQVRELLGLGGDAEDQGEVSDDGMDVLAQEEKAVTDATRQGLERKEKTTRQKKDDDAFLMKYVRAWRSRLAELTCL
jgi:protein KRI1